MNATLGGFVTEYSVAIAAAITTVGLLWRKVVKPLRDWMRRLKVWMTRVDDGLSLVEAQLRPNGSPLVDKIEQAKHERAMMREQIEAIQTDVRMLLKHDAEWNGTERRAMILYNRNMTEGDTV